MSFWVLATAMSALVAALIALALVRGRKLAEPAAAYDLRVYRDQLKEVDRDLARGVISDADADRVRTEVSRRILAADAQVQSGRADGADAPVATAVIATVCGFVLVGGSLWIYAQIGAPGYGDLALANRLELAEIARSDRPDQAQAETSVSDRPARDVSPDFVALMAQLRDTVADRPNDLQGHVLLARNEAAMGNFRAAYEAQARVIELKGEAAEASDFADYADMLIIAAGGYVSPQAEAVLSVALEMDPANGPARYYWGLMMGQTGRPDVAFRVWERLLAESPGDAAWVPPVRAQIEDMAARAGVPYTLPPLAAPGAAPRRGPSNADIAAAEDMSPEDRLEMIRSMVSGLGARLSSEGGPPEEWAQLITSLSVLGRRPDAEAVYAEAVRAFADAPGALDTLRRAAERAGIAP